jgi:hypothetical protein
MVIGGNMGFSGVAAVQLAKHNDKKYDELFAVGDNLPI